MAGSRAGTHRALFTNLAHPHTCTLTAAASNAAAPLYMFTSTHRVVADVSVLLEEGAHGVLLGRHVGGGHPGGAARSQLARHRAWGRGGRVGLALQAGVGVRLSEVCRVAQKSKRNMPALCAGRRRHTAGPQPAAEVSRAAHPPPPAPPPGWAPGPAGRPAPQCPAPSQGRGWTAGRTRRAARPCVEGAGEGECLVRCRQGEHGVAAPCCAMLGQQQPHLVPAPPCCWLPTSERHTLAAHAQPSATQPLTETAP